ncbi:MAG TPA: carboxypeptidase regulatory-like domain-containing protein [Terriglobia bacterium]|jgi:hypothetical protein
MFGGVPVPGATVTVTQGDKTLVTVTDPMGAYSFPDLKEGPWPVEIEMLGFAKLKGDTATTAWELKMLSMAEIKADVVHNEPAPTAAAAAPAAGNAKGAAKGAPATPRAQQTGFAQTQVNQNANAQQPANPPAQQTSSTFANASQDELNSRAADASLINGTVNNGAASPFAQLGAFGNNRRGLRPLYNGGIGLVNFDTSALDARSYSLAGANTTRPSYSKGQLTFNFGGPLKLPGIIKNNNGPNFFFGYSRTQNRTASVATGRMPTDLERMGDFSETVLPTGLPAQVIDPVTGQPFGGDMIPGQRISPQAQSLLAYFPKPNFTGNPQYNYQIPIVGVVHTDAVQTQMNKSINQRNQVNGNFAFQSSRTGNPNLFSFLDSGRSKGINAAINWTFRPTQRFSSQFGFRFGRQSITTTPFFANKLNVSGLAGITGNNQDPVNWGPTALNFTNGTGVSGLSDAQYSAVRNQTTTVSYGSFWNHGRHNIQFGGDMRRAQFNTISQQDPRGTFTFTGAIAGVDFADFLLGVPGTSEIAFGNADKYFRQTVTDLFFQDDWRINGALTLMLGARWEYETPISEKYNRLVNLSIGPNFTTIAPAIGNDLINKDPMDILPRFAFAWRPIAASSVIVRGSYGIYRNTGVYQSIANQMAQQAPLSKSLSVPNSAANPLTLANGFNATQGISQTTFAVDPNFKIGYADNWTLSVQRDLPFALQMTANYLGTKGTRLPQEFLPNTFPTGAISPTGYIFLTSNGNSTRHAGQIQVRRRLRSGFTSTLQYTYAKAIDDAPLMGGAQVATVTSAGTNVAQNWLHLDAERALSSFDQRHQLSVQGQYSTGSGVRGGALLSGWKGAVLKSWTFASALTVGSGTPETPTYFSNVAGTGVTGNLRPNVTGASITAAPEGKSLNPAAFSVPAAGQFGNAARNSITGPTQFSLNSTLGRTFPWGDRYNIDLTINAANVMNHVAFTSWNTNISAPQFGLPASANQMRILQTTVRVRF